jgi:cell division protein FtsZ
LFDLPVNSYEEIEPVNEVAETTNEIKNINVTAEEIKPQVREVEKRYVLDDFNAQPTIGKSSTPVIKEEVEEALQFEVKTKTEDKNNNIEASGEEVSPLSITISELQKRTQERRDKMKGFNYKFNDQVSKNIDEIERQPAYKRLGVDINTDSEISKSDTALNTDNNDLLRSNNSFLHDNVD